MQPVSRFSDANGLRFHYLEWGDPTRPAMLLLHGFMAYAAVFGPLARAFEDQFRVIGLDQRGHGDSGWSPTHEYDPDVALGDVEAVVAALVLHDLTLIGFSMGGRNAFRYVARYPDRVRRLVIMDMGPALGRRIPLPKPGESVQLPQPEVFDSLEAGVAFLVSQNPRAKRSFFEEVVPPGLKQLPDGRWTWKWDPWIGHPARHGTVSEAQLWEEFRSIKSPVLVLRGAESPVLDPDVAERMARELPQIKLFTVPNAGHTILDDNPEFVIARVREFLDES